MHFLGAILSHWNRQIPSIYGLLIAQWFHSSHNKILDLSKLLQALVTNWCSFPCTKPWQLDSHAWCHCLAWSDLLCHESFFNEMQKPFLEFVYIKQTHVTSLCGLQVGPNLVCITVLLKVFLWYLMIVDRLISREGFLGSIAATPQKLPHHLLQAFFWSLSSANSKNRDQRFTFLPFVCVHPLSVSSASVSATPSARGLGGRWLSHRMADFSQVPLLTACVADWLFVATITLFVIVATAVAGPGTRLVVVWSCWEWWWWSRSNGGIHN